MLKDMESFQGFEQQIDYFEALRKVEDNVKLLPTEKEQTKMNEDEDYLNTNDQMEETKEEGYQHEYQSVIFEMSQQCSIIRHDDKPEKKDKKYKMQQVQLE